jgi:hypothetical protein
VGRSGAPVVVIIVEAQLANVASGTTVRQQRRRFVPTNQIGEVRNGKEEYQLGEVAESRAVPSASLGVTARRFRPTQSVLVGGVREHADRLGKSQGVW